MNGDDKEDIGSQDTMDINVIILMFPNPTFSALIYLQHIFAAMHCINHFPFTYDSTVTFSCLTIIKQFESRFPSLYINVVHRLNGNFYTEPT